MTMERRFSEVKLTGGPIGNATKLEIDGHKERGVTSVHVSAVVNDVVRVEIEKIVTVEVEMEVPPGAIERTVKVRVQQQNTDDTGLLKTEEVLARGEGRTVHEALQMALDTLTE